MIRRPALLAAILLASCTFSDHTSGSELANEGQLFTVDSKAGRVANLMVGMTEAEVAALGYRTVRKVVSREGENYVEVDLSISNEALLTCLFDQTDHVYEISTSSGAVKDEYGLGVGSTLREVEEKYPSGELWVGEADGRYANFVTGTAVIFRLSKDGISDQCFSETRGECHVKETTTVSEVVIGKK